MPAHLLCLGQRRLDNIRTLPRKDATTRFEDSIDNVLDGTVTTENQA
jgi:hypothetical protein